MTRPIAIGSDDAGFPLKEALKGVVEDEGYPVTDYGCDVPEPVDYPDVALEVARAVARGEHDRAVLVCGTGIGMAIAANKVPGVFEAVAHDPYSAARARMSNDAHRHHGRPGHRAGARQDGPPGLAGLVIRGRRLDPEGRQDPDGRTCSP